MSALPNLNWQYVTDPRDPKFMVKGTRIAQAVYGFQNRFAICEVRRGTPEDRFGVAYGVSDASTVSDAEVKAGVLPKIVKFYPNIDECVAAIDRASEKLEADYTRLIEPDSGE